MIDWQSLDQEGFPKYIINEYGDVRNADTGRPVARHVNQTGQTYVSLYLPGSGRRKMALAPMVARVYVHNDDPTVRNTVIHKDGDKTNVAADNLEWRSRSYAVRYQRQFRVEPEGKWKYRVRALDERSLNLPTPYASVRDAGMEYGLLDQEVITSATGERPTPTYPWLRFMFG